MPDQIAFLSEEVRPWGSFHVLVDEPYTKVKILKVSPGQRLSYQSHKHRSEHWVVAKGVATVTLDGMVKDSTYGQYIYVPQGSKHRLANLGSEEVWVIETQVGDYFGEDDITRYSDDYERV